MCNSGYVEGNSIVWTVTEFCFPVVYTVDAGICIHSLFLNFSEK